MSSHVLIMFQKAEQPGNAYALADCTIIIRTVRCSRYREEVIELSRFNLNCVTTYIESMIALKAGAYRQSERRANKQKQSYSFVALPGRG
jgi:hypothetical protein